MTMSLTSSSQDQAPTAKRLRANAWQQETGVVVDRLVRA